MLTRYVTITLLIKPGIISYIPNSSLILASGLTQTIQVMTTRAPAIIPLIAPARVSFSNIKKKEQVD